MSGILIFFTVIFWGIAPIIDKAALKNSTPFIGMVVRGIFIGITMSLIFLFSGRMKDIISTDKRSLLYFCISGLLAGALGVLTFYKALELDSTSKVVPLAATYPLVTAILGVTLLGESITIYKLVGIVFIVIGILLVK